MRANLLFALCCFLAIAFAPTLNAEPLQPAGQDVAQKQDVSQETDAPQQPSATDHSNINVETWVKPQSGWLYVLDPEPATASPGGRIWLLDPDTGKAMGSIRTGDYPDFALSPDGSRLYVTSAVENDLSEFAVIDTAKGAVIKRDNVGDREVPKALPPFSMMSVSGDGLALRIVRITPESEERDMFLLATYNTETRKFSAGTVRLYNCGPGRFISHDTADHFDFLCPRSNRIRLIHVDEESRELHNIDITLPWERRIGVAEAIELPGADKISIIRADGGVFEMDAAHEFTDTPARPDLPNRVPPAAWPTSPDGTRLYLGYNNDYDRQYDNRFYLEYGRAPNIRPENATASEFRVLDTHTWRKIGTIKTKMPFWGATITNDGKLLYATVPHKHTILVIDTAKMHEVRALKVGGAPTLALVAP
jgi:hypothetical protein